MDTMLVNFMNGNLTTARRQAKKFSPWRIVACLRLDYGYSAKKALLAAQFLKGADCWHAACDAD